MRRLDGKVAIVTGAGQGIGRGIARRGAGAAGMTAIRAEVPADFTAAEAVVRAAFERSDEAELVARLRRAADPQISLVAVDTGRVVGHVFFSPVTIDGAPRPLGLLMGLAPVAVAPERQNGGIGSALIRAGLDDCRPPRRRSRWSSSGTPPTIRASDSHRHRASASTANTAPALRSWPSSWCRIRWRTYRAECGIFPPLRGRRPWVASASRRSRILPADMTVALRAGHGPAAGATVDG